MPRQEYDIGILGWSKTQMKQMLRTACQAQKKAGTQACSTTLLRIRKGKELDPRWRLPKQQVILWAEIWNGLRADPEIEREMRVAWERMKREAKRDTKGPISNTMQVLEKIGWDPTKPDEWKTDEITTKGPKNTA